MTFDFGQLIAPCGEDARTRGGLDHRLGHASPTSRATCGGRRSTAAAWATAASPSCVPTRPSSRASRRRLHEDWRYGHGRDARCRGARASSAASKHRGAARALSIAARRRRQGHEKSFKVACSPSVQLSVRVASARPTRSSQGGAFLAPTAIVSEVLEPWCAKIEEGLGRTRRCRSTRRCSLAVPAADPTGAGRQPVDAARRYPPGATLDGSLRAALHDQPRRAGQLRRLALLRTVRQGRLRQGQAAGLPCT